MGKLSETITAVGQDDAVKVVVLQSKGDRTFCAGASFDELISISDFTLYIDFYFYSFFTSVILHYVSFILMYLFVKWDECTCIYMVR